ncbi:sodium:calcium antiporter [Actinoplanes bogorensis]|uniref:Sodium:calcium antiporter n=1 Tax=Paractinoplanes bogorensis TaxID=1610840 RepID=A0ABS5Z2C3_9ACTN|nr:sodium:calcium antiporter [Actinoplanes bogorensis]MBU2669854.1 sodium:calcium antiporter [Actinoplanes bogorensis]
MIVQILLAAAGLVLLTVAADHLVLGSSRLGRRLRISPVVIGVVIIGLGTSMPEFLVSGLAAARGEVGLAVGNIVGSNILNLSLLLGIAAVIAPVPVAASVIRREVPLAVTGVVLFGLLALAGLGVGSAVVLTVACAAALWLLIRWARTTAPEVETAEPTGSWRTDSVRTVLGLAGVLAGAQMLVVGASATATMLGVSPTVIGFTLVAIGTSLPELVTTVQAQRRGESGLVVGNLFGSNLFNSLAGGAVIGFADSGRPAHGALALVVVMVAGALLAGGLLLRGGRLTRGHGVLLGLAYVAVIPLLL